MGIRFPSPITPNSPTTTTTSTVDQHCVKLSVSAPSQLPFVLISNHFFFGSKGMSCAMHTGFFCPALFLPRTQKNWISLPPCGSFCGFSPLPCSSCFLIFLPCVGSVVGIFAAQYSMTGSLTSQWEIQVFPVAGNTIMLNSEGQALPQVEGHSPCLCSVHPHLPHSAAHSTS